MRAATTTGTHFACTASRGVSPKRIPAIRPWWLSPLSSTTPMTRRILKKAAISEEMTANIISIISQVSFHGTDSIAPDSLEGKIVQDADRLDALGAIGIARTFAYGGSRGRAMFDPTEALALGLGSEAYHNHKGSSLHHFFEKLFTLKDLMNTEAAKAIAEQRERFLWDFVIEFYDEWF